MTRKVKLGMAVAGSLLTLVGGIFGVKSLTGSSTPTRALAQNLEKETPEPKAPWDAQETPKPVEKEIQEGVSPIELTPMNSFDVKPITLDPVPKRPASFDLDPQPTLIKREPKEPFTVPPFEDIVKPEGVFVTPRKLPEPMMLDPNLRPVQDITFPDPPPPLKLDNTPKTKGDLAPLNLDPPPLKKTEIIDNTSPKITLTMPSTKTEEPRKTPEPLQIGNFDPIPMNKKELEPSPFKIDLDPAPMGKRVEVPTPLINEAVKSPNPVTPPAFELTPSEIKVPIVKVPVTRNVDLKNDIYDEDIHRPAASERYPSRDAQYRALSEKYYEDSGYYRALALYNGTNPTGNGTVRIPPIEVLEKRFPDEIEKLRNRTSIQTTSASAAPTPRVPLDSTVREIEIRTTKVYSVEGNGESLRQIAQKTLGNEGYWSAIKELNKWINEEATIPAGTKLFLPPQAQVNQ